MGVNHKLNSAVATLVMGYPPNLHPATNVLAFPYAPPDFSGNIADAWLVVEKMRPTYSVSIKIDDGYTTAIAGIIAVWASFSCNGLTFGEHAPTLPEAICRAALKAVGVEVPA